jgi:hypothetical protein
VCGDRNAASSFHLFKDRCISSAVYGQFFGMVRFCSTQMAFLVLSACTLLALSAGQHIMERMLDV